MDIYVVLIILFWGILPTLSTAYGVTAIILDRKNKIGDINPVEFNKHLSKTIDQFECSKTAMQAAIKQLKSNKGISGK